jgi:glycosyltransferase involved in cell wall biosynthesis
MEWSVIVFCYNEAPSIRRVVSQAVALLEDRGADYEIILVNDGSTDDTAAVCRELSAQYPFFRSIDHPKNMGIGTALQTGYRAAKKKYICAIPGDGQFNIELLREIPPFEENVFYSFYRKKTNYNYYRSVLTWGNRTFNSLLLGVNLRDVNWIKVYTRDQLALASLKLSSSLIETEICAKLIHLNIKPIELQSDYLARSSGTPKGGSLKTLLQALKETIKLVGEVKKFKRINGR